MAEKESVRRTGDCRVKLAPSMMERLEVGGPLRNAQRYLCGVRYRGLHQQA